MKDRALTYRETGRDRPSNNSHVSTSGRSATIDHSSDSYDYLLKGEPTLPSMGSSSVEEGSIQMPEVLEIDPLGHFVQGARYLVRP